MSHTGQAEPTQKELAEQFTAYAHAVQEALIAFPSIEVPYKQLLPWEHFDHDAPLMNAEIGRAHDELVSAWKTLECLQDRLKLLAQAYRMGDEISAERVDAKHGIAGKQITITVDNAWGEHPIDGDWDNTIDLATSGAFHLSYGAREDDEEFALGLLFQSLGFAPNRDSPPVWTAYQTPPVGTITRLREGLERLGYHYRVWKKRTYRIAAELGDDDQECSYEGAPAEHIANTDYPLEAVKILEDLPPPRKRRTVS
ncbi:hypothetical protein NKY66_10880 [Sinorhizobium meliloti]|uniref:hypothetical protein n=1 Tax=Rhizobium meliloti TaxID=382 RepID=UPI003D6498D9